MADRRAPDIPETVLPRGSHDAPTAPRLRKPAEGLAYADTMGVPGTRTVPDAPRLPRLYLPRPRLWAQLDKAPLEGITLLVAPAGAGKTLGVGGWLRTSPAVSAARWVHADSSWSAGRLLDNAVAIVGSSARRPMSAPGMPTLVRPVR